MERRPRDVRALAAPRPQLVSVRRSRPGRAHDGQGVGRLHRADPGSAISRRRLTRCNLRRSALAAALHADAEFGAIASGFDRGLSRRIAGRGTQSGSAGAMERLGHPTIGKGVYQWLNKVRQHHRAFLVLVPEVLARRRSRVGNAGGGPDGADPVGPRASLSAHRRSRTGRRASGR